MQQFLEKKNNSMTVPINPEVSAEKHRKMHIQKVVSINFIPSVKKERSLSAKKPEHLPPHPPTDKNCHNYQVILSQHLDHMTKRA